VATDAIDAMTDALVTYFASALPGTWAVRNGWPGAPVELDLDTGPCLAVTVREVERVVHEPELVGQTATDDVTISGLWRFAHVTYETRLDLFARSKAARAAATVLLAAELHNDFPVRTGLYLTATDYESRPFEVYPGPSEDLDEEDGSTSDLWRRFWLMPTEGDLVVRAATKIQAAILANLTTYTVEDGDEVTTSDIDLAS
jgi:hypothetical protein